MALFAFVEFSPIDDVSVAILEMDGMEMIVVVPPMDGKSNAVSDPDFDAEIVVVVDSDSSAAVPASADSTVAVVAVVAPACVLAVPDPAVPASTTADASNYSYTSSFWNWVQFHYSSRKHPSTCHPRAVN